MANQTAPYTQADVKRAVKGAIEAGLTVVEVVANRDGVRLTCQEGGSAKNINSLDRVFNEKE